MELPDLRRQAMYLGRLRFLIGLSMLVMPARSARIWSGPAGSDSNPWIRMTGLREVAIGAGTDIAAGERNGASWLSIAALVDVGDGLLGVLGRGVPTRTRLFGLAVIGLGVAQLMLSRDLAAQERPGSA
ncbi:MAG: hypothetical protein U0V73_07880 [Acidimicrobiia bacterium]